MTPYCPHWSNFQKWDVGLPEHGISLLYIIHLDSSDTPNICLIIHYIVPDGVVILSGNSVLFNPAASGNSVVADSGNRYGWADQVFRLYRIYTVLLTVWNTTKAYIAFAENRVILMVLE